ncbi:MAG: UDP-N-acetylglucosamine 1-carboxyvinyltransferase, partial [Deltaproteobacteria bacterium]|nr:UDP-N-acetylglucosamine 1-carboxyvinyltransferase [Deltaproteobacteria bacterium]
MDKIIVTGGKRLEGEIKVSGAKNAALPILISSLLADGWNTYRNVPRLMDIESTKVLLSNLGAEIETDGDTVRINAQGFHNHEAPYD